MAGAAVRNNALPGMQHNGFIKIRSQKQIGIKGEEERDEERRSCGGGELKGQLRHQEGTRDQPKDPRCGRMDDGGGRGGQAFCRV
jgi:hypothetical protein